jgi:hypothetical protein
VPTVSIIIWLFLLPHQVIEVVHGGVDAWRVVGRPSPSQLLITMIHELLLNPKIFKLLLERNTHKNK